MNRGKVLLLSDSNGRHMFSLLHHSLHGQYSVFSFIKPNAKLKDVVDSVDCLTNNFNRRDYVLIIGGTNDVSGDAKYQTTITEALDILMPISHKTNLIVTEIPKNFFHKMYKIIKEANKFIRNAINIKNQTFPNNVDFMKLEKILKRCDFTRHGLHMNMKGKMKVASAIASVIIGMTAQQSQQQPISIKCEPKQKISVPEKTKKVTMDNTESKKRKNKRNNKKKMKNENKCMVFDEPVYSYHKITRSLEKWKLYNRNLAIEAKRKKKLSVQQITSKNIEDENGHTEKKKYANEIVTSKQITSELENKQEIVSTHSIKVITSEKSESNLITDKNNNIQDSSEYEKKSEKIKDPVASEIISHRSIIYSKSNPEIYSNENKDNTALFKEKVSREKRHKLTLTKSCPEINIEYLKCKNISDTELDTSKYEGIASELNTDAYINDDNTKIDVDNNLFDYKVIKPIIDIAEDDTEAIEKLVKKEAENYYNFTNKNTDFRGVTDENYIKEICNAIITIIMSESIDVRNETNDYEIENTRTDEDNVICKMELENNDDKTKNINTEKSLVDDVTELTQVMIFEKINLDVADIENVNESTNITNVDRKLYDYNYNRLNIENNDERKHIMNYNSIMELGNNTINDNKIIENIVFEIKNEVSKVNKLIREVISDSYDLSIKRNSDLNVTEPNIGDIEIANVETEPQAIEDLSNSEININELVMSNNVLNKDVISEDRSVEPKNNDIRKTDEMEIFSKKEFIKSNGVENKEEIHFESENNYIKSEHHAIVEAQEFGNIIFTEPEIGKPIEFENKTNIENESNTSKFEHLVIVEADKSRNIRFNNLEIVKTTEFWKENENNDTESNNVEGSDVSEKISFTEPQTLKPTDFDNGTLRNDENNDMKSEYHDIVEADKSGHTMFNEPQSVKPTEFQNEDVIKFENIKNDMKPENSVIVGSKALGNIMFSELATIKLIEFVNEDLIKFKNIFSRGITNVTKEDPDINYIENLNDDIKLKIVITLSDVSESNKFSNDKTTTNEKVDKFTYLEKVDFQINNVENKNIDTNTIFNRHDSTDNSKFTDVKTIEIINLKNSAYYTPFSVVNTDSNYIENRNNVINSKKIGTFSDESEDKTITDDKLIETVEFEKKDDLTSTNTDEVDDLVNKDVNEIELKNEVSNVEELVSKDIYKCDFISYEKSLVPYIKNKNEKVIFDDVINTKMSTSNDIEVLNKRNSHLCMLKNNFTIYQLIDAFNVGSLYNSFTNNEIPNLIQFKDENEVLKLKKIFTKHFL